MRELHGLVILERTKLGKLDSDMVIWGKKLNFDGERFRSGTTCRHLSHLSTVRNTEKIVLYFIIRENTSVFYIGGISVRYK